LPHCRPGCFRAYNALPRWKRNVPEHFKHQFAACWDIPIRAIGGMELKSFRNTQEVFP